VLLSYFPKKKGNFIEKFRNRAREKIREERLRVMQRFNNFARRRLLIEYAE
jgi:hypothetical protein